MADCRKPILFFSNFFIVNSLDQIEIPISSITLKNLFSMNFCSRSGNFDYKNRPKMTIFLDFFEGFDKKGVCFWRGLPLKFSAY